MCGSVAFGQGFLFNLFIMKYVLGDVLEERSLTIERDGLDSIILTVETNENPSSYLSVYLEKDELYELIGVLHHIQKQMK